MTSTITNPARVFHGFNENRGDACIIGWHGDEERKIERLDVASTWNKILKAGFFWCLLVSSDTAAQILVKVGSVTAPPAKWPVHPLIFAGYSFYILSFIAWMHILKHTRLSIALSAASVLYVSVALGSHFLLGEAITLHITLGTILISIGVFILGWSESRKE
jgi:drug/metabolite transporter (DMT)-like permease